MINDGMLPQVRLNFVKLITFIAEGSLTFSKDVYWCSRFGVIFSSYNSVRCDELDNTFRKFRCFLTMLGEVISAQFVNNIGVACGVNFR